jgi:hypothetical protein
METSEAGPMCNTSNDTRYKAWDYSDSSEDSQDDNFAARSPFQSETDARRNGYTTIENELCPGMSPVIPTEERRFNMSMPIAGVHMHGLFSNAPLNTREVAQAPLEMKEVCFRVADEWLVEHAPEVRELELFTSTNTASCGVITQPVNIGNYTCHSEVGLSVSDATGNAVDEPILQPILSVNLGLLCGGVGGGDDGILDKDTGNVYYYKDLGHNLTLVEITPPQKNAPMQVNFGVLHGKDGPTVVFQSQWVHPDDTAPFDDMEVATLPMTAQQLADFSNDAVSGSRVTLSTGHHGTLYTVDEDAWPHVHVQDSRTLEGDVRTMSRFTKQLRTNTIQSTHPDDCVNVQLLNGAVEVQYARDEAQDGKGDFHLYAVEFEDPSIVCKATELSWYMTYIDPTVPLAVPEKDVDCVCAYVTKKGGFKGVKLVV